MKTLSEIEPRTPITNLPYTITIPGSYYVTTNLTASTGITISTNDVTLDLGGFTLGPGFSGPAISVPNPQRNLAIRNGVLDGSGVRGTNAYNSLFEGLRESNSGGPGLLAGSNCVVSACSVSANYSVGIGVGNNCTVKDCTVSGTSGFGIQALNSCVVADCTSYGNSSDGVNVGVGTGVRSCASYQNGGNGVTTSSNCTVIACTATGNNGAEGGIYVGTGCTVKDCTANGNNADSASGIYASANCSVIGCTTSGNNGYECNGIEVVSYCTVKDCTASGNNGEYGDGIYIIGVQNRIDGNNVGNCIYGIYPHSMNVTNSITRNFAPGNAYYAYFNYAGNNDYAPTGSVSTATNPWTNF